ncbi:hypothetical protein J1605_005077 [Eschrichtius robustus]|uniref:Uncharacterized protein n=1 Tax=Eschrichtius robustus TaxID=9764 RepID=A0AB34HCP4_ESCRO|nr:hypothetical protein J1605_005077 [Eschrichtius robustus]
MHRVLWGHITSRGLLESFLEDMMPELSLEERVGISPVEKDGENDQSMGEMQIIGGDDLSTLAGKVRSSSKTCVIWRCLPPNITVQRSSPPRSAVSTLAKLLPAKTSDKPWPPPGIHFPPIRQISA